MPLSYRIIKNKEEGKNPESFEIPIISTEDLSKNQYGGNIENRKKEVWGTQAKECIKNAEQQAKNIIEQARKEARIIKKQAEDRGYQDGFGKGKKEGYKQGYEQGMQETNEVKENAKQLLQSAHKESRKYIEKTRQEIIDLASSIARNIIHFNIDTKDESLIEMVKNALRHAEERKQIIIRSHPDCYLMLQTNLYQFKKICPNAIFTFLEDKAIKGKGCIIESEEQVINLEIDHQLENIVSALSEMGEEHEI